MATATIQYRPESGIVAISDVIRSVDWKKWTVIEIVSTDPFGLYTIRVEMPDPVPCTEIWDNVPWW